jgi:hypothetical protein
MSDSNANKDSKVTQKSSVFTCSSCGGSTVFDPESQSLKCEYCDSLTKINSQDGFVATELELLAVDEQEVNNDWGTQAHVFVCKNCGGETVLEGGNISTRCVFCSSPQVVLSDELPGLKPGSVLPFKVTPKTAKKLFATWVSKRFWAPNSLKKKHKMDDKIDGVYVPYWTYDADTYSTFSGTAGNYYYVPQTYSVVVNGRNEMRTRQVQKVRWFPVSGENSEFFDDILINDGANMNDSTMKAIEPFDLTMLEAYNPQFLAGFATEKYTQGVVRLWTSVKAGIEKNIRNSVNSQILTRADVVGSINIDSDFKRVTYKHTLLPVWLSSYKFGKKVYQFCINGQTGEVQGRAPVSPFKVMIAIAIGAVAAYYLIQWIMA